MYTERPQSEFNDLIIKYTWFKKGSDKLKHYHFSDISKGAFLEIDDQKANLIIRHHLYKEDYLALYSTAIIDDQFYLQWWDNNYSVLSIKTDSDTNTAEMLVNDINKNDVAFSKIFLGYIGDFDESIFKK